MMIAIMAVYLVLLFLLVHFGIVTFNLFWKASPFIVLLLLNLLLFIPMGWGAPQGSVAGRAQLRLRSCPSVAGEVTDVPVVANTPLKAGDVLFRIDPAPYEAQVKAIEAQLKLSDTRLSQMTQLYERDAGRAFDVQQRQSEVDQLKAQLEGAQWNLDKTVVQAPADGYVTNLALRKGARVANLPLAPVMAFIDTSRHDHRRRDRRRSTRAMSRRASKSRSPSSSAPGQIYAGKVESVLQAVATGQAQTSGTGRCTEGVSRPFPSSFASSWTMPSSREALPAGATGDAAIFTEHVKAAHVIRNVLLRQVAILNYVNPF